MSKAYRTSRFCLIEMGKKGNPIKEKHMSQNELVWLRVQAAYGWKPRWRSGNARPE